MGITFLKLKVIHPEHPKKSQTCEFLADSGAVYSVVLQSILKKLGITPTSFREFILANGEVIKKPAGNAYFEHEDQVGAAPVICGDEDVFLLGATTLEALGLILDRIRRQLKPLPMLVM